MAKIHFKFKIDGERSNIYPYYEELANFEVTGDVVPEDMDPVEYLRQRLNEEVLRAAMKIPLPRAKEA